jgi:hypothetical protein
MQMPMPPVSQCKKRHMANPDQEKKPGMIARTAPRCRPPIQRRGAHAALAGACCKVVDVAMITL